jgi:hypothetical protein
MVKFEGIGCLAKSLGKRKHRSQLKGRDGEGAGARVYDLKCTLNASLYFYY